MVLADNVRQETGTSMLAGIALKFCYLLSHICESRRGDTFSPPLLSMYAGHVGPTEPV